jgi:hypothetical protein
MDVENPTKLKEYGKTLTKEQKRQARDHIMTVRAIRQFAGRLK